MIRANHAAAIGPIIEIESGRIQGLQANGVNSFKKFPFAADTSGAGRFCPPALAAPWRGCALSLGVWTQGAAGSKPRRPVERRL